MITANQVSATATAAPLVTTPAGPCLLLISNDPASAGTAYIGSAAPGPLSSTNGYPLPAGQQMTIAQYEGSSASALSVVCAATKTASVGWCLSTDK